MGLMKAIHRWVSTVGMLFIAYVAMTGTAIAVFELIDPATFGAGGGQGPVQRAAEQRAADRVIPVRIDGALARTALQGALAALPAAKLDAASIRLYERDGLALADVTIGSGYQADKITINARTGERVRGAAEAQAALRLNSALQRFHSGAVGGAFGKVVILLTGLALLTLCLTGAWLYFDMWRRRAGQGRKSMFWG
jgi:uncharacterized iron-regulated membrane protein